MGVLWHLERMGREVRGRGRVECWRVVAFCIASWHIIYISYTAYFYTGFVQGSEREDVCSRAVFVPIGSHDS